MVFAGHWPYAEATSLTAPPRLPVDALDLGTHDTPTRVSVGREFGRGANLGVQAPRFYCAGLLPGNKLAKYL